MQWVYIICFSLISAGLLALFGVRPGDFIDALFRSQRKAATLSDELNVLMGTPAKGFFNQDYELKQILKGTGRSDRYEAVKRLSLILFAVGAVLALLINNVYMVPILGIGFSSPLFGTCAALPPATKNISTRNWRPPSPSSPPLICVLRI